MDKKSLRLKREFEEIIKNGARLVVEETELIEPLSDEDMQRLRVNLPPNDMYDRIIRQERENKHIRKRKIKRILIIAAIIAIFAFASSAMAFKFFGARLFSQSNKHSIRFIENGIETEDYSGTEKSAFSDAEKELGHEILRLGYIPEGFYLQTINVEPNDSAQFTYVNSESLSIRIKQTFRNENSHMAVMIDSAEANSSSVIIGGYEVDFVEYERDETAEQWIKAFWHDEVSEYELTSNISMDEIEKILQELK